MGTKGLTGLRILLSLLLGLIFGAAPALAEVEQCRFIQAKPEREACYTRQEAALAAKRKPEPSAIDTRSTDARMIESLQQMRRDDAEVYRSVNGICRGC
ncbi:hypothetical protein [Bradyrhizobium sp. AUGA SZCCT0182]|uniref:hypothetical protein n=1 Tax=Bradyrhizobium sp. AUGA SZCCT0182 TaxID=2807667 RepID=UPI00289EA100|nr:hypothetical protein [Bradyrhizobium sp. AUGA SZCCT0182]